MKWDYYVISFGLNLSLLIAADVTVKSAGTDADGNGISFQNSAATELMVIEGDGDASIDGTTLHIDAANNKVGFGTASPTTQLHVSGTEGLLVQGTYNSGTALNLGTGTRMHFYSLKAAFRAGYSGSTQWDDANIGTFSAAFGLATIASGASSTALGNQTIASGDKSIAAGQTTTASGEDSAALGSGTEASGASSTALGSQTEASGKFSAAMGYRTTAQAQSSLVIGQYNTETGTTDSWVSTDPLFVCGNGSASDTLSDALTLLKNGNMTIAGTLTENSDLRLKERIQSIDSALEKVLQLDGKYFFWNEVKPHDMKNEQVGLIAQEVQEVIPQLVAADQSEDAYLSVNYSGLAPVLINAMKEQQAMISELQLMNEDLRSVQESQQARIDELTRTLAGTIEPVQKEGFFKRLAAWFKPKGKTEARYSATGENSTKS